MIALPSVGLHTNGYSLARKLLFEVGGYAPEDRPEELGGRSVGEALLAPHKSYLKPLDGLLETGHIKGLAHITGGGLVDNVPRILPAGTALEVELGSWPSQPLFDMLVRLGNLDRDEAHRALNMGVGMVVVASEEGAAAIEAHLDALGEAHSRIGRIVAGDREVRLVG